MDSDGDGRSGAAGGVGGVEGISGGLRGGHGNTGAPDRAGIRRNFTSQDKVTWVPAAIKFELAVKEMICGATPLGMLFCV